MKNSKMISWTDPVNFTGNTYKRRVVHVKGFGDRVIAGESLKEALLTSTGAYVSDEAKAIDEGIFFFIEDKYLNCSDVHLAAYVEKQLA